MAGETLRCCSTKRIRICSFRRQRDLPLARFCTRQQEETSFINRNTSTNSGGLEQSDDVLDGVIGFVVCGFELAAGAYVCSGLMMEEAIGERPTKLLVKEDEQQRYLC